MVQKYIEFPLLAPVPSAGKVDLSAGCVKFDTRIWVLVTSFQPLQAHIFPIIYGRRCGTAYSTELATLGDSYTHLTNYSVQKKQTFADQSPGDSQNSLGHDSTSASGTAVFDVHAAGKLRSVLQKYRTSNNSGGNPNPNPASGSSSTRRGGSGQQQSAKGPQRAESDLLMCKCCSCIGRCVLAGAWRIEALIFLMMDVTTAHHCPAHLTVILLLPVFQRTRISWR